MKYRKKSVETEAFQYDGDLKGSDGGYYVPDWVVTAFEEGTLYYDTFEEQPGELFINNPEGAIHVPVGDYIIKGVNGDLYPSKPDIFEQNYETI